MYFNKNFKIRLNEFELEQLKENAKNSNLSVSEYIRRRTVYTRDFIVDTEPIRELNYEFSKIGTNINQIVKLCNYNKFVDKKDIELLVKKLNILENKVHNISSVADKILKIEV